ncbi:MAG: metallophosphoesterase family protein [Luteibaculaceae bacterium]
MRILLLSDTHGYLDKDMLKHASEADEIWHAGDIGDLAVADALEQLGKPFRAVYGNIDGTPARIRYPENAVFTVEGIKVAITHIGGKPYAYPARVAALLEAEKPAIYICGHSHILQVQQDKKRNFLFMNPGAAGKHGFHKMRTMLRFSIERGKISNLAVIEWPRS